jgi:flagellar protein FliS
MFSTMSRFGSPQAFSNLYRRTGVETGVATASPHRLVAMLFEGLNEAIAQAHGAMAAKNVNQKVKAISRAIAIVDEGLRAALDMQAGGQLAADLNDLYSYITVRLTQANLRNDPKALDECKSLIAPLHQAWNEIAPTPEQGA